MFSDDVFIEQIVVKKPDTQDQLKKVGIILACVLLCAAAPMLYLIPGLGMLSLPAVIGLIYGAWYLISGLRTEYEYIYTNGELDVDRISAKRRRRRLLTLRMRSIDTFGKLDEAARQAKYEQVFMACADPNGEDAYIATFRDQNGKPCCLYFTPNEQLVEIISEQLKRKARYGR